MTFVLNEKKVKRIIDNGITSDCPLFVGVQNQQALPTWIWKANELQIEALVLLAHFFTKQCVEYTKMMIQHGGSATDNEIAKALGWYPSIVSARRNELKKLGIVKSFPNKRKMGPHCTSNTVWSLDFRELRRYFLDNGASL